LAIKKINGRLTLTIGQDVMDSLNDVSKQLGISKTDLLEPLIAKFVKQQQRRIRRANEQK
jgi:hypothetical protein